MAEKDNTSTKSMVITSIVAIVLIALIWPLSQLGKGSGKADQSDEADVRIQPVAKIEMQKAAAAPSDGKPRDGAAIYNSVCMACHASGVAGAPKTGDKAAWAPRIAQGAATLLKNATEGKGAMPPKGGATDLSDAELKAAVDHLVNLSK